MTDGLLTLSSHNNFVLFCFQNPFHPKVLQGLLELSFHSESLLLQQNPAKIAKEHRPISKMSFSWDISRLQSRSGRQEAVPNEGS